MKEKTKWGWFTWNSWYHIQKDTGIIFLTRIKEKIPVGGTGEFTHLKITPP